MIGSYIIATFLLGMIISLKGSTMKKVLRAVGDDGKQRPPPPNGRTTTPTKKKSK